MKGIWYVWNGWGCLGWRCLWANLIKIWIGKPSTAHVVTGPNNNQGWIQPTCTGLSWFQNICIYTFSAKYVELFWAYIAFSPVLLNYWAINNPSTANPQTLKCSSNPTNVWLFGGEGLNGSGATLGHAHHGGRGGKISTRCKDLQNSKPYWITLTSCSLSLQFNYFKRHQILDFDSTVSNGWMSFYGVAWS